MQRKICVAVVALVGITAVATLLSVSGRLAQAADKEGGRKDEPKEERKEFTRAKLIGRLRLYPPVPIQGPYPYLLYTARAGDLVELQLSYPIAPPFPKAVRVRYNPAYFEVVDVVGTDNEVVVLKPGQAQTGVIGLGYYSVYLKAKRDGQTSVQVPVEFDDGDTETVPFNFQIGPEAKTPRHGP